MNTSQRVTLEELAAIQNDLLRQVAPLLAAMERTTSAEGLARITSIETTMVEVRDAMRSGISWRTLGRAWEASCPAVRRPRHLSVVDGGAS